MGYERWVFSLSCVLILLVGITINAQTEFIVNYCSNSGNYTNNSTYQTNLYSVISSLSSNPNINDGFYNFSVGRNSDRVNVIGLCRGDVEPGSCRSCISESGHKLTELCPNRKEAIGWADNCMIRYSNRSIFSTDETSPSFYLYNVNNASNTTQFNQEVRRLLDGIAGGAAAGGSTVKFATGNVNGTGNLTIYGLVQCTPDLSEAQCSDCLDAAFRVLPQCCDGKIGGRVLAPSCNFRYETYPFYNQTTIANAPPPHASAPSPPAIAPPPVDGTPPPVDGTPSQSIGPPPPPPRGKGEKNKAAVISVSTLMAAVTAILVL